MPTNNNVLVIGGAGYIGAHTTLALVKAGYTTTVYTNADSGADDWFHGVHLVYGDLVDVEMMRETLRKFEIGCVVHLVPIIEAMLALCAVFVLSAQNFKPILL